MGKSKKGFRLSIRAKTVVMITTFALSLVLVSMTFFSLVTSANNTKNYEDMAGYVSKTVAATVDVQEYKGLYQSVKAIVDASPEHPLSDEWGSERWNAYIAQFDAIAKSPEYQSMLTYLRKVVDANSSDVDCAYLCYVDPTLKTVVYVVDSAPEDEACPPGCLDPLYEVNYAVLSDPSVGFPAYVTNTAEYGYLVTVGTPIYDGNVVIGYASVDVSMETVRAAQAKNILRLLVYLISMTVVITIVGITVVHFTLIRPVKRLRDTANAYNSSDIEATHRLFSNLHVNTRDELTDLAGSMRRMEMDVYDNIHRLTAMNEELSATQSEARKMTELANTDALTGLRNKVAYNYEAGRIDSSIKNGEAVNFGIAMVDLNYLKFINDDFGHDKGDEALVRLAKALSNAFAHSPIFRIGGDEFVVILKNEDYDQAPRLIRAFNNSLGVSIDDEESLEDALSAALGYAKYDPDIDTCVEDVFKRADQAMYARKRAMKANRG